MNLISQGLVPESFVFNILKGFIQFPQKKPTLSYTKKHIPTEKFNYVIIK